MVTDALGHMAHGIQLHNDGINEQNQRVKQGA